MRLLIWETLAKIAADMLAVIIAFIAAYYFRLFSFHHSLFPFHEYIQIAFVMAPVWIVLLGISGRYRLQETKISEELRHIFFASLSSSLLFPLVFYFSNERFFSRAIIGLLFIFSVLLLSAVSILFKKYSHWHTNMLIIGSNRDAQAVVERLLLSHSRHIPVVALSPYGSKLKQMHGVPIVGKLDALERTYCEYSIDEIFLCEGVEHSENLASFCRNKGITLRTSVETLGMSNSQIEAQTIGGTVFLTLQQSPLFGWGQFFKRLFDVVVASGGLIIFSPVLLWNYKNLQYRAFQKNTDECFEGLVIIKDNSMVYSRWTLLWNVLKKDISMVGPRLFSKQEYADMFGDATVGCDARTLLRCGVFSPSEHETTALEVIRKDIAYIQQWSFCNDIQIILGIKQ